MALSEFSLINDFFKRNHRSVCSPAHLGIGDDCALIAPPQGKQIAISTDTLVEGVHFLPNTPPETLGHKVLAVNLSDLAAMGATPAWATLALTLPNAEETWLEAFASGFFELANAHGLQLIGGDTTRGPLTLSITIMGLLPESQGLTRSGAQSGDSIYVTGSIGDAGLGLLMAKGLYGHGLEEAVIQRYLTPEPRIEVGTALLPYASACIDVSDGLIADLTHVLKSSDVGARIFVDQIPISPLVKNYMQEQQQPDFASIAGDDYELCFTVPQSLELECLERLSAQKVQVTQIGKIQSNTALEVVESDGRPVEWSTKGYQHQWDGLDES